jgi:hypothetical protein
MTISISLILSYTWLGLNALATVFLAAELALEQLLSQYTQGSKLNLTARTGQLIDQCPISTNGAWDRILSLPLIARKLSNLWEVLAQGFSMEVCQPKLWWWQVERPTTLSLQLEIVLLVGEGRLAALQLRWLNLVQCSLPTKGISLNNRLWKYNRILERTSLSLRTWLRQQAFKVSNVILKNLAAVQLFKTLEILVKEYKIFPSLILFIRSLLL